MIPSPQRARFSFIVISHFCTPLICLSATLAGQLVLGVLGPVSQAQSAPIPEPAQDTTAIPARSIEPLKTPVDKQEEVSTWIRTFVDRSGTEELRLRAAAQLERAGLAEEVLPAFLAVLKNPREKLPMRRVALDLALRSAQRQALVLDDLSQLLFDEQTSPDFKQHMAEQMAAMTFEWAAAAQGNAAARTRALNWIQSFERSLTQAGMPPQPSVAAARQVLAAQPGWLDWSNHFLTLAGIGLGCGVVAGAWIVAVRFRNAQASSDRHHDDASANSQSSRLAVSPVELKLPEPAAGPTEAVAPPQISRSDMKDSPPAHVEHSDPTPIPEPAATQPVFQVIAGMPKLFLPAASKAEPLDPSDPPVIPPAEIDSAIAALSAPVPLARRRAATQLALMGRQAERAIPALANRLADEQERLTVRQAAACALAGIGVSHPTAIQALLSVITTRERGLVLSATRALVRMGSPALAELQAELCAPRQANPSRVALLRAAAAFGSQAECLLPALVNFLSDSTAPESVRCAAADAIGKMGSRAEAYVPNLISAMCGGKHLCRSAANALVSIAPGARLEIVALFQMQQPTGRAEEQLAEFRLLSACAPVEADSGADVSPFVQEQLTQALEALRPAKISLVSGNTDLSPWPTPPGVINN